MMIRLMLFLALNGAAAAAPLTLTVEPGHSSTTTVNTGSGQAVRQTDFSGALAGEVVLDAVTRLPQAFRFEGGSLQYGNAVSQYTPAELLEEGPLLDRYQVEVEHVSDATPVVYNVPSTGITLNSVTTGGFSAHGEALVPSAGFHAWMMAGGAEEPVSLETRVGAWPGSVLYALGLAPGVREIPWTLDPAAGTLRLDLPAGGTRVALKVEHSPALSGWLALPLPGGGIELPAGTSGPVTVALPSRPAGFVRLAVSGLPGGAGS